MEICDSAQIIFYQKKTGLPKICPHKNHLEFEQNSSGFFLETIFPSESPGPKIVPFCDTKKPSTFRHISFISFRLKLPPTRVTGIFRKLCDCEVFRRFYLRLKKRSTQTTSRGRPRPVFRKTTYQTLRNIFGHFRGANRWPF